MKTLAFLRELYATQTQNKINWLNGAIDLSGMSFIATRHSHTQPTSLDTLFVRHSASVQETVHVNGLKGALRFFGVLAINQANISEAGLIIRMLRSKGRFVCLLIKDHKGTCHNGEVRIPC